MNEWTDEPESDQDGVRRSVLLGDRADGAHRDGRGHGDALLGGQVLLAQAVEETAGTGSRDGIGGGTLTCGTPS